MQKNSQSKAIDANVLVRVLVKDDLKQSKKALAFIQQNSPVFIGAIVLVESIWVLESCYQIKKPELITILESLFRVKQFEVEHIDACLVALKEYAVSNADFSDCLIGAVAQEQGCELTVTFDKKAAKSVFFALL